MPICTALCGRILAQTVPASLPQKSCGRLHCALARKAEKRHPLAPQLTDRLIGQCKTGLAMPALPHSLEYYAQLWQNACDRGHGSSSRTQDDTSSAAQDKVQNGALLASGRARPPTPPKPKSTRSDSSPPKQLKSSVPSTKPRGGTLRTGDPHPARGAGVDSLPRTPRGLGPSNQQTRWLCQPPLFSRRGQLSSCASQSSIKKCWHPMLSLPACCVWSHRPILPAEGTNRQSELPVSRRRAA